MRGCADDAPTGAKRATTIAAMAALERLPHSTFDVDQSFASYPGVTFSQAVAVNGSLPIRIGTHTFIFHFMHWETQ